MTDWHVGQRVVCVRWDWEEGPFGEPVTMPVVGQIYTVRDIEVYPPLPDCAFRFEEIVNPPISFGSRLEPNFDSEFFRPLDESEADDIMTEATHA